MRKIKIFIRILVGEMIWIEILDLMRKILEGRNLKVIMKIIIKSEGFFELGMGDRGRCGYDVE